MDTLEGFLGNNDATLIISLLQRLKITANAKVYLPDDVAIRFLSDHLNISLNTILASGKFIQMLQYGVNPQGFLFGTDEEHETIDGLAVLATMKIRGITYNIIDGILGKGNDLRELADFHARQVNVCGFTEWNRIMEAPESCNRLSSDMKRTVEDIVRDNANLIYYYSHPGDAVKNAGDNRIYDYLTPEFKALSYGEKIDVLKRHGLRNFRGINFKEWPLQQWGKNLMRYAVLANKHILYVQADSWYCAYPSMFAEAMCSSEMFTGHKHYPGSGFHFYGPLIDLFCVGDYSIEREIKHIVSRAQRPIQTFKAEEYEWWNMTDQFLLSLYSSMPINNDISLTKEWMLYPSIIWRNIDAPIKAYNGQIQTLTGMKIPFSNVRTFGDLQPYARQASVDSYSVLINGKYIRVDTTITKLPLTYLLGAEFNDKVEIVGRTHMSQNPTAFYSLQEDVIFDGMLDQPNGKIINIPANFVNM
jgi:hypothetical protein